MKIALINNSGNVGKTTIAREVLGINMPNAVVIEIETHNTGNAKYEKVFKEYYKINATDIEELYAKLIENEDVILDIGASNILDFLRQLEQFAGLETLIDLFLVPSTKDAKQLQDTLKTINILLQLGINPNQIVVIANRVNPTEFERDFKILINAQKEFGFRFSKDLSIRETSLLKDLELLGKTLTEIINDNTDYRKKIIETKGTQEQAKWVKMDLAKMAGKKVYEDFKRVYESIIGG
jgi:CTP synthase (UTP-ammonia lyase)